MIEFQNLTKSFPNKPDSRSGGGNSSLIIGDFSDQIQAKDFVGVLGPSGCGKSTLLRLIAQLEKPDSGKINLNPQLQLAFVFQESNLLPWLSVEENALLHYSLHGNKPDFKLLSQWLDRLNLRSAKNKFPHELSGGMKMRASFLRAMMMKPELLLLDEPFAALDEVIRVELQRELFKISREKNITVIFVTHSISEAVKLCDRIMLLDYGGKKILDQRQDFGHYQFQLSNSQQNFANEILSKFPKQREFSDDKPFLESAKLKGAL
ncbi:MAG: ABC transporter ATP-binding protein, partial [Pseudobdellovibrionaceae bacterium]